MTALARLGTLWNSIQAWLFPMLEDELGELDDKHREFVAVCETCAPQTHMDTYRWVGNGCPPNSRLALCKAFIAKAVCGANRGRTGVTPTHFTLRLKEHNRPAAPRPFYGQGGGKARGNLAGAFELMIDD